MNPHLVVRFVESDSPDFALLVSALDVDLVERYPALSEDPPVLASDLIAAVVAYRGDVAVGSGALRELEPRVVEVKHMFVLPAARGLGIARRMLHELEARGAAMGYAAARLGSGVRQPEALGLYESSGYHRIPLFGEYQDGGELCVCYEKALA